MNQSALLTRFTWLALILPALAACSNNAPTTSSSSAAGGGASHSTATDSSTTGTSGSGQGGSGGVGAASCAPASYCDDFESYAPGSEPNGKWSATKNMGSVSIDTTKSYSGGQSVKISTEQGTYKSALIGYEDPAI